MTRKTKVLIAAGITILFAVGIFVGVGVAVLIMNANKPSNNQPLAQNSNPEAIKPDSTAVQVKNDGLILYQAGTNIYTATASGANITKTTLAASSTKSPVIINATSIGYGVCETSCILNTLNISNNTSQAFYTVPGNAQLISLDWSANNTVAYLVKNTDGSEQAFVKKQNEPEVSLIKYAKREFGRGVGYNDQQTVFLTSDNSHIVVVNTFESATEPKTLKIYKLDGTLVNSFTGAQVSQAYEDRLYFIDGNKVMLYDFPANTAAEVFAPPATSITNPKVSTNNKLLAYWWEQPMDSAYALRTYEFASAALNTVVTNAVNPYWTGAESLVYLKTVSPQPVDWMGYKVASIELVDVYGNNQKTLVTAENAAILDVLPVN